MMVASMVILRARITFVNISSQMVQVLGFIRLGRTPNARNGTESIPRIGTGICICSQHPLQILDCSNSAIVSSGPRERRPDPTSGGWREQGGGIHHPASANYIPQESAAHPRLTAGLLAFAERLWRSVKYEEARRND